MNDVTELVPILPPGDIEVWLITTASDLDGIAMTTAHPTEEAARGFINSSSSSGNWQRCLAITKVRIPRGLLKERWQKA